MNKDINLNKVIIYIKKDRRLNTREKLVSIILFSYLNTQLPPLKKIAHEADISLVQLKKVLKNLDNYGWCDHKAILANNNSSTNTLAYLTIPPKFKTDKMIEGQQPGSRIAHIWPKLFGTSQLTPTSFSKIKSFLGDGMEEKVIIEVMKIGAEQARGNPVSYTLKILNDYINKGILSYADFKKERGIKKEYEEQIQKDNRAEKKRKELHNIEKLKKRGWN